MVMSVDDSQIGEETAKLSEFVADTNFSDLGSDVIKRAKLTVADTISVAICGSSSREMQKLYNRIPSGKESSLLKQGFPKSTLSFTAFANATAICFLELDEGSRPTGHPALHVLPSALALSQSLGKSGSQFLTAFILGYEVQYRIQKATRLKSIIHPHGNFGNAGAIAAIGKLSGWNAEKIRNGINASVGLAMATSWQPCLVGATVRNAYPGLTAQIAFTTKLLIESGFTGYGGALAETFGEILGEDFQASVLTEGIGKQYGITHNYFKFHAACALNHSVLDALAHALGMKIHHGSYPPFTVTGNHPDPKLIKKITVTVSKRSMRLAVNAKENELSSKFSIPYAVATFLVNGTASVDSFRCPNLGKAQVKDVMEKVEVVCSPEFTARWPIEDVAEIKIEMADGNFLQGKCSNPFGSASGDVRDEDLFAKFRELTSKTLNSLEIDQIWNHILNLEKVPDMEGFPFFEQKVSTEGGFGHVF